MAISATIKDILVHVGDLVRVHYRILEGEKERTQLYEGMVIKIRGRGDDRTFTVRKIATGNIGVERIFPLNSPWIQKMEIKKLHAKVRRAKLYFVREKSIRRVAQITNTAA